jgi:hypothetical protein
MPGVTNPMSWPDDGLAQDRYGDAVRGLTVGWVCPFGMSKATPIETDILSLSAAAFKKHVCSWIGDVQDGFVDQSDLWNTMRLSTPTLWCWVASRCECRRLTKRI